MMNGVAMFRLGRRKSQQSVAAAEAEAESMESLVSGHPLRARVDAMLRAAPSEIAVRDPDALDVEGDAADEAVAFEEDVFHIFSAEELDAAQVGYARLESGESLVSTAAGAWRPTWLVVGYWTLTGDPILVDLDDESLPVLAAFHGQGSWSPYVRFPSLEAFLAAGQP